LPLRLSVLDQSPIRKGGTPAEAVRDTLELAQLCDRLGYTRYWLGEHHSSEALAGSTPEVLITRVAGLTERMKIGSGGVMLPHYSALKVAETFRMLGALYPNRVDLGVGRAPDSDPLTAWALQRDKRQAAPDDFPDQLTELLAYIRDGLPAQHRLARTADLPPAHERPTPWLLGSSPQSGVWAAELGLPYAFADFIGPGGAATARRYVDSFVPSRALERPQVIVAVWALCAPSDEEADRLASSSRMAFAHFLSGHPTQVPPVDEAVTFLRANAHLLPSIIQRRRAIVGSPTLIRERVEAVAEEYGADEVMIVTITHAHDARVRSYELLAETFGLAMDEAAGVARV